MRVISARGRAFDPSWGGGLFQEGFNAGLNAHEGRHITDVISAWTQSGHCVDTAWTLCTNDR